MKLKQLKKLIDSLTPQQLNQDVIYNSDKLCQSGLVDKIVQVRTDLYYTGEDDPAKLYTKKQLKENGYTAEEIEDMEIEIPKGSVVIYF